MDGDELINNFTCEFHRVGQSWRSLWLGRFSCFCFISSWDVASGLLLKWPTIARAFARSLGSSDTSRAAKPPFTTSCSVCAKHGRHLTRGIWVIAFFTLAPESVTTVSWLGSIVQSASTSVNSAEINSAVWLPGAGLTARHLLCMEKEASSQCAVTPIYAWLLDDVHMSVVTARTLLWEMRTLKSLFTSQYRCGIMRLDMAWRVGRA